jgi:DNA-cytosine methyltransferase
MENPDLWLGKGEQKTEGKKADPVLAALDKGKIKGVAGMNAALWNTAIDTIKAAYTAGKGLAEAINEGIAYLKSKGEDVSKYQDALDDIRKAEKPRVATFFSGAGTMEAALPNSESVMAVEYSPTYMKAYNDAFGTKYEARDVTKIDPQEVKDANPDIFHASPVCKNFSKAKNINTVEKSDMDSAESVARVIREAQPPVVTIENVPGYKDTVPFNAIIKALEDAGYTYDVGVYNAADFGGSQNRNRLFVRAVKDGKLPAVPSKKKQGDWYKAVEDLIDDAPDAPFTTRTKERNWEQERIDEMIADGRLDASKPIITMGASAYKGEAAATNAGNPSPTLLSSSAQVPRIIMPDDRIKRVTPEMMKRLMDLPLSYPVPADAKVAKEVLGNGMDGAFTKALIEPLIKPVKAEDRVEKFLKDLYWKEGGLAMNAGLWNATVTTILKAYQAGKTVYEAIQAGIDYLKKEGEDIKEWQNYIDSATERLKRDAEKNGREIGTPMTGKPKAEKPPVMPPPTTPPTEEGKIKERKTITSIKDATDISDSVKEALGGDRTKYEVLPNQVSVKEATAILDAIGADKAKEMVLTNSKEMPSAFRTTLAQVLIKQYNKEGKFQDAVDVAEGIAEIATDWGQGIQALSMFEYLTPEGQLLAAQREIDRQRNKRFVADKGKMDKLKTALKKADDEAVTAAVESVVADTTPAPEATRAKSWGEKNKIITKSVYEAAKKALKNIKLFSTPLPEELITIAAYHIEAGARSFADFSKEMIKDFGRKVKPYLKAAYKNAQAKVGGTGYSSDTEIAKHFATDLEKDIKDILKESGIKIRDVIKQHYSEGERTKEALTKALVEKLGLDEGDASIIAEKVNEVFTKIANEKKQQALKAIEKRTQRKTPERKTAEQKLIELSNLGALDEKAFKEEYAKAMGFPELTAENAAAITELAEKVQQAAEGRPKQKAIVDLLNYQANIKGIDAIDVGTAIWMASILSGPVTQAKNIFGNVFNMSTLLFDMALTNPKDLPFILKGLSVGLGNGVAEGGTTLVTGYPPMKLRNEAMGILERAKFNKLSPYQSLKYVTRFMLASDALTYGGLREMRAYQKALSEAKDKYPSVDAVQKAIEILGRTDEQYQAARETAKLEYDEEVARIEADNTLSKKQRAIKKRVAGIERFRRVYDLIEQNRPESLVADAHDFAAKGTFTNTPTGTLGVGARFLNGVKHNIKLASLAVPFTNTIANVANNVINYTPLGYVRAARGGSILMGRQKEFTDEDKARMVRSATLGLTAAVATYILSAVGGDDEDEEKNWFRITAEGYGDYKKNKELEATGWKPYSIKIGDTWWSYQLTPLMGILSAVGAIRDYEKYHNKKINESDMNKLVIPIQVMLSTIAESSYLSSVEGFLSALLGGARGKDPVQELTDWITKTGAAVVPIVGTNFYQQNAQMIQRFLDMPDKEYRGTYFGKMLRNIPYARDQYFNTVNGLGEEMLPPRLNILYSKSDGGEYAKLWQLMADKNQVTSKPERNGASYIDINGEEKAMTDEQFYMFSKTRGEYIRNLMMVSYDKLKEMDEKEFTKWMQSTKSGANRFANDELALQYEKGIYEKNIQPFKAEAAHERDRMVYAIEKGDTEEAKTAFGNYEKLSPQSAFKDRKALFTEIVDDKVAPAGIKPADRIDFFKGVLLGDNRNIKIEQKQPDGKVKMVQKPFNEIFTEEERADFKRQYFEQEETVAKKLEVLDDVLGKKYFDKTSGEALWRRYVKRVNKK